MSDLRTVVADGARLWDRRQDEAPIAYEVFSIYRDMGQARSLERLYRIFADSQQIKYWSQLYSWQSRCAAFDHCAAVETNRRVEEGIAEATKRHRRITRLAQKLAIRELRWYLEKAKDTGRFERLMTGSQLAKLMKDSITLERLILGEATERIEGGGEADIDYSQLSVEELGALHELLTKAKKQTG
jgi:hypothetical protein